MSRWETYQLPWSEERVRQQLVTRYDWLTEGALRDHLKYRDINGLGKHVIGKRPLLIHVGGYTRWLRERGRRRW